jgi:hypothetical protein
MASPAQMDAVGMVDVARQPWRVYVEQITLAMTALKVNPPTPHPSCFYAPLLTLSMIMRWHQPLDICRILPICTCDVWRPHCHRRCACKCRVFEYGNGIVTYTYLYIRATSSWILLIKPGILRRSSFVFHRAGYMWQNVWKVHLPWVLRWTCLSRWYLEYIFILEISPRSCLIWCTLLYVTFKPVACAVFGGKECSGRGECVNMRSAALMKNNLAVSRSSSYPMLETDRIHSCKCDRGYTGPGCELMYNCTVSCLHSFPLTTLSPTPTPPKKSDCPHGVDPLGQTVAEVYKLKCDCGATCSGTFRIYFNGERSGTITHTASMATFVKTLMAIKDIQFVAITTSKFRSLF